MLRSITQEKSTQMKTWGHISLLILYASSGLFAQNGIVTHNDFNAQVLVKDIFASGACNNIDFINPIGNTDGIGYFENGSDIIGLDKGILLSTGHTNNAAGPNSNTNTSGDFNDGSGDTDLSRLATATVSDAVGIEFDFVPLDSFVSFRYVFASEEYCEFAGSQYNDVFGFFISGPGINGTFSNMAKNVALVPGSNDFVAINTINPSQHSQLYVHNERPDDIAECHLTDILTPHINEIEYDGFTTVLTSVIKLHPCERYHIRLVVGDVSDRLYDSAVFLEAGSFNLGGKVTIEASSNSAGDGQIYEGCDDGYFRFSRSSESPIEYPLTVNYHVSAASTAEADNDYEALPGHILIPAGYAYADLPLRSLNDDLEETDELLRLVLDIPCACYSDSADIIITTAPLLENELQDAYACPGEQAHLSTSANGGIAPYTYQWSNGENNASIYVDAIEGQLHQITITDACEHSMIDSAWVWQSDPPSAYLSGATSVCQGDTSWLDIQIEGQPPYLLSYQIDGIFESIELQESGLFPVVIGGQYNLFTITDAACTAEASGQGTVELWSLSAEASIDPPLCFDEASGYLAVNMTAGSPPFTYHWDSGQQTAILEDIPAGVYTLEVVDNHNCSAYYFWELFDPLPLAPPAIDCEDLFLDKYTPSASGGTPPYQYAYENELWQGQDWYQSLAPGEEIHLQIKDANGCYLATTWQNPMALPNGIFLLEPSLKLPLGVQLELTPEWLIPLDFIESAQWSPADQLSCSDCFAPLLSARIDQQINLLVTDIFGCQDSMQFQLKVSDDLDAFIPNAFSPNGDQNNDEWHIYANPLQVERIEELIIFDRWGNFIFQAKDWPINSERHGWDGRFRGKTLDPGVFAYSITFRLVNGQKRTIGGSITLVR